MEEVGIDLSTGSRRQFLVMWVSLGKLMEYGHEVETFVCVPHEGKCCETCACGDLCANDECTCGCHVKKVADGNF